MKKKRKNKNYSFVILLETSTGGIDIDITIGTENNCISILEKYDDDSYIGDHIHSYFDDEQAKELGKQLIWAGKKLLGEE